MCWFTHEIFLCTHHRLRTDAPSTFLCTAAWAFNLRQGIDAAPAFCHPTPADLDDTDPALRHSSSAPHVPHPEDEARALPSDGSIIFRRILVPEPCGDAACIPFWDIALTAPADYDGAEPRLVGPLTAHVTRLAADAADVLAQARALQPLTRQGVLQPDLAPLFEVSESDADFDEQEEHAAVHAKVATWLPGLRELKAAIRRMQRMCAMQEPARVFFAGEMRAATEMLERGRRKVEGVAGIVGELERGEGEGEQVSTEGYAPFWWQ